MKTRIIRVGDVKIGGGNPISIQSMCNTKTSDALATIEQINQLEEAGCDIVRVSVPDMESADSLREIRKDIAIPLVADIHFDYRLAVASAPFVDKLRINPGNIGGRVKEVVQAAQEHSLPIRIGVNMGSLDRDIELQYGRTPLAMVESAAKEISILESFGFQDIAVSLKASDIDSTIKACRLFHSRYDYPQHIGITESGTSFGGTIKSSIGLGILLSEGIGDTMRVSLAGDPLHEVKVAKEILKHLGKRKGLIVTACPTCARVGIDVEKIAREIEDRYGQMACEKHVAVMGCVVNGPGEAQGADIAIVGSGEKDPHLYINGRFVSTIPKESIIDRVGEELSR